MNVNIMSLIITSATFNDLLHFKTLSIFSREIHKGFVQILNHNFKKIYIIRYVSIKKIIQEIMYSN